MYILARLNLDSQCISVGAEYADLKLGLDAKPFKAAIEKKKAAGNAVKAAMTFPGGTHDLWIRYWLAAGGIDPDKDIETIVVPPPQMVANMKVGTMDCFCVGEPWNEQLKNQKIGYTAINTGELWDKHPEKSFAMRADWVDKNPKAAVALLMAVQEAAMWATRTRTARKSRRSCASAPGSTARFTDIEERLKGKFDYGTGRVVEKSPHIMKFWRDNASYPYQSHELWFLTENVRWGKFTGKEDFKALIAKVNREDLWRDGGEGTEGAGGADPDDDVAWRRKILRWQSVRSGEPRRVPGEPRDQAVGLTPTQSRLHALRVRALARRGRRAAAGGDARAARPGLGSRSARRPTATLPPPSKVIADTWELIINPFYDNGGIDKGLFWHLLASLKRVALGYALRRDRRHRARRAHRQQQVGDARARSAVPGAAHDSAAGVAAAVARGIS